MYSRSGHCAIHITAHWEKRKTKGKIFMFTKDNLQRCIYINVCAKKCCESKTETTTKHYVQIVLPDMLVDMQRVRIT